ncbi:conserved hypothetical protein [Crenothrix polyspora]|jgi:hypothetical protein|uniref:Uncharacterized protein n=1 Tax=Crenothrix polyspora TaxID=360316 RepID=A0A1R4HCI2_9GAMM|nr:hypothetical protein [Crenothrix polyspora]SJM93916.1 conserved hypothetical protein [Crenothrix polyspora]
MNLISSETSLVIAGAWNPAILTPAWVLQHGLDKSLNGDNVVKTYFPATLGVIFEPPRYELEKLSFVVLPNTFILFPIGSITDGEDDLEGLEDVAAKILQELKHTPITGVGHNLTFKHSDPKSNELDVFTASTQDLSDEMPSDWLLASRNIAANFKNADETVIINVQRQFEANEIVVRFNFHHPVSSIESALAVLRGNGDYNRMSGNIELAKKLMNSLYGECKND